MHVHYAPPPPRDDHHDKLTVCDWNKKLSFYQLNAKQVLLNKYVH